MNASASTGAHVPWPTCSPSSLALGELWTFLLLPGPQPQNSCVCTMTSVPSLIWWLEHSLGLLPAGTCSPSLRSGIVWVCWLLIILQSLSYKRLRPAAQHKFQLSTLIRSLTKICEPAERVIDWDLDTVAILHLDSRGRARRCCNFKVSQKSASHLSANIPVYAAGRGRHLWGNWVSALRPRGWIGSCCGTEN